MVKVAERTRMALAALAGIVVLATAHAIDVLTACDRSIAALAQETSVADAGDLMLGLASFRAMVLRPAGGPGAAPSEQVRERFQVLRTQLSRFEARHADAIANDPTALAAVLGLDGAVLRLAPTVADADRAQARAVLADGAQDMQARVGQVATAAAAALVHAYATAVAARTEASDRLMWLLGTLSLSGALLIASLFHANRRLNRLARRDMLTGLPNRLAFTETLSALMKDPGPANDVAVMLIDVDRFKQINDTLGHAAGDLILAGIAGPRARLAGRDSRISRLGGDEFAGVRTAQPVHRAAADAVARITALLARPLDVGGTAVAVSLSIGVALTPLDWCDAETMLRNADVALYAAKAAGRGTFRVFNPRMDRDTRDRRAMADDLRAAVARRELDLHFQPIVDLATRRIVGCEALARWNRPRHGPVSPAVFIALAEEIGLIQDIGDWVLGEACRVARAWPEHVGVSINLSPHQFDRGRLPGTLARVLAETGIRPGRIQLEITESLLLRQASAVQDALKDLRGLGLQIALDDFGTGYSCLSYLQRFPIDRIKIDRSFVREIVRSAEARAIVETICQLAAKLRIATTGEGIESEDHAALLGALGCRDGQGYLFARPVPAAELTARLGGRPAIAEAA